MTLSEFRDLFLAEYIYEAQKRGVKGVKPTNLLIASWLSEAQQNINTRLKPIKTYQDIPILTGATDYTLNTNFGKAYKAFLGDSAGVIGDTEVKLIDTIDLLTTDPSGNKAAIYWDPTNSIYYIKVITPTSDYYIRLWYYADTLWFSPSGSVSQDWGNFDDKVFSGNLKIPDKYQMLVKYYMLGKCFNDYSEYEKQLSILRVNNANTQDNVPEYKWNDP